MKKLFIFIWLLTSLCANLSPAVAQNADWQSFETYVNKVLTDWQVPGAAVAVVKDDKIVYAKGFGVKEISQADKISERTIFGVAS